MRAQMVNNRAEILDVKFPSKNENTYKMNSRFESLYVQFHNRANELLQQACHNFDLTTGNINREVEEYRFQEVKLEHVRSLEKNLGECAALLLQSLDPAKSTAEASQTLQQFIRDYLHRFVQKIDKF